jgi:hypothetical protein
LRETWGIAAALQNLGRIAFLQGEYERSRAGYAESLTLYRDLGAKPGVADCLQELAILAASQEPSGESPARATRLLAAAEALRDSIGAPLLPRDRDAHLQAVSVVRQALGDSSFIATWAAGRAVPLDLVIEEALHA